MIKASDLCGYARAAIGGGYCYGSSGEMCSKENREAWAEANPSQKDNLLGVCAKWDGMYVWDCSGLFRGAWCALDEYKSGGATTIHQTWCEETGEIGVSARLEGGLSARDSKASGAKPVGDEGADGAHMPDEPGIAVFRGEGDEMEHIGLYVGNGMVVDARGSTEGVLYQTKAQNTWTNWGRLTDVDYSEAGQTSGAMYRATVKTAHGDGIGVWPTPASTGKEVTHVYDGGIVDVYVERTDGWREVEAAPHRVYSNGQYLIPIDDPTPQPDPGDCIPRADVEKAYKDFGKALGIA